MKAYSTLGCGNVIIIMSVSLFAATYDSHRSFLDAEAILAAWESTYGSIRTMSVSYSDVLEDYRPPASNPEQPPPVKCTHVKRVESGKRYHILFSSDEAGFDSSESLVECAFDGTITRHFWARMESGTIVSGLTGRQLETENRLKALMLLDTHSAPGYLKDEYPDGLPKFALMLKMGMKNEGVTVLPNLESIANKLCHVIEVVLPGGDHEGIPRQVKQLFWMAHDNSMCLMKYQFYWDEKLSEEIEVEQIARSEMDGVTVWYPQKAHKTLLNEAGIATRKLNVTEFIPNVDVNESTFQFAFPTGTHTNDRVSGLSYVIGGAGPNGEVPPVRVMERNETIEVSNEVNKEVESAPEEQEKDYEQPTNNVKVQEKKQIPIESMNKKDKILGTKTLVIFGVAVFAGLGLLFWYKRTL